MKKRLLFLVMTLFCLSVVFAINDYKQVGEVFNRSVACTNDGAICSTGSCNITIINPNGQLSVDSASMAASATPGWFYLQFNDTRNVGEYQEIISCCDGADCNTQENKFIITNTGMIENDTASVTLFGLGFFLVLFVVLTIFFYLNGSGVMYMFLILSFIMATVMSYVIYNFQSVVNESMKNILYVNFWIFLILTLIIVFFVLLELTFVVIGHFTQQKKDDWKIL
jgi:hypothetical protein